MNRRHLYLLIAPAFMCVADAALTLSGQSEDYWNGSYHSVNELSPDVNTLLTINPTAFCVGVGAWLLIVTLLLLLLPRIIAIGFCATVTVAHSIGCMTWIIWRPPYGYQVAMAGCIVVGCLLTASITLTLQYETLSQPNHSTNPWWRWALIFAIIAVPIYTFLVPH